MAYKIQFRLEEDILYFEIAGNICNHMDSVAAYVQHRMAESRTGRVLLDLRGATGRPSPAKVFTHVLKYPPMRHVDCAVIHREQSEDFLLLYAKLMRHRGHRVKLFGSVDEATAWLLGAEVSCIAATERAAGMLRRLFQNMLVRAKAQNDTRPSALRL